MNGIMDVLTNPDTINSIGVKLLQQIYLAGTALVAGILISVPMGVVLARIPRFFAIGLMNAVGVLQTIPSLALLSFMIPIFGVGAKPAIIALFVYALLPIVSSTYSGLKSIDPGVVEAARGMGMTRMQILTQVEFPLTIRVIASGIRISSVLVIGWATLGAFIGAGGLGDLIFAGFAVMSNGYIIAGAVPVTLLAIVVDWLLGKAETSIVPLSLRKTFEEGEHTI